MAGVNPQLFMPTLTAAPSVNGFAPDGGSGGGGVQPHHGLIGIVLLAVLVLFLLDRAGFRFAVAVGRS